MGRLRDLFDPPTRTGVPSGQPAQTNAAATPEPNRLETSQHAAWILLGFLLLIVPYALAVVIYIDGLAMAHSGSGGLPFAESSGLRIYRLMVAGAIAPLLPLLAGKHLAVWRWGCYHVWIEDAAIIGAYWILYAVFMLGAAIAQ